MKFRHLREAFARATGVYVACLVLFVHSAWTAPANVTTTVEPPRNSNVTKTAATNGPTTETASANATTVVGPPRNSNVTTTPSTRSTAETAPANATTVESPRNSTVTTAPTTISTTKTVSPIPPSHDLNGKNNQNSTSHAAIQSAVNSTQSHHNNSSSTVAPTTTSGSPASTTKATHQSPNQTFDTKSTPKKNSNATVQADHGVETTVDHPKNINAEPVHRENSTLKAKDLNPSKANETHIINEKARIAFRKGSVVFFSGMCGPQGCIVGETADEVLVPVVEVVRSRI